MIDRLDQPENWHMPTGPLPCVHDDDDSSMCLAERTVLREFI